MTKLLLQILVMWYIPCLISSTIINEDTDNNQLLHTSKKRGDIDKILTSNAAKQKQTLTVHSPHDIRLTEPTDQKLSIHVKTNRHLHNNKHTQQNKLVANKIDIYNADQNVSDKLNNNKNTDLNYEGKNKNILRNVTAINRLKLINQAVKELKSVLNTRSIPAKQKSKLLKNIFDAQGDPKKASLANEIFRLALAPAMPTSGAVGDLGAEMIKVSVFSRLKNTTHPTDQETITNENTEKHNHKHKHKIHSYLHNIKIRYKPLKSSHENILTSKKTKIGNAFLKLNSTDHKRKKHRLYYKPVTHSNNKYRRRRPRINMRGKTAKLLAIKIRSPYRKIMSSNITDNVTNIRQTRKDYVIELDDDNNQIDNDYARRMSTDVVTGDRRGFDPVITLLNRFAKNNNDDVTIYDERDDDRFNNPNDMDDGYISPKRRQIGQNLFLNSFADDYEESEEPESEQGFQRSFGDIEDRFDDQFEPRMEPQYAPVEGNERNDYESPAVYEQAEDDNYIEQGGLQGINENDNRPIIMEIDKRNKIRKNVST